MCMCVTTCPYFFCFFHVFSQKRSDFNDCTNSIKPEIYISIKTSFPFKLLWLHVSTDVFGTVLVIRKKKVEITHLLCMETCFQINLSKAKFIQTECFSWYLE